MDYQLEPMGDQDGPAVLAILNQHIASGFAAYPSQPHGPEFWGYLRRLAAGYPAYVVKLQGAVVGYGLLRPHLPPDTMARTAEVSYFLRPEHTGRGLGARLLERLVEDARARGVDNLLANVSSGNPGSLRFHQRHGFSEVGRFVRVGRKWDQDFDVVWLQRFI
ncbi:MAG: N-acetyltransferase family protein [Thermodesulfobacteriota bacterium]